MKILFVGGHSDGKLVDAPDAALPEQIAHRIWAEHSEPDERNMVHAVVYREQYTLRTLHFPDERLIYVYAVPEMDDFALSMRMIACYRPQP